MKHASEKALDSISGLLDQLRSLDGLKEKKRGVYYRKSKAFLHFHEDAGSVFADLRTDGTDFERFRSTTAQEQKRLFETIKDFIRPSKP